MALRIVFCARETAAQRWGDALRAALRQRAVPADVWIRPADRGVADASAPQADIAVVWRPPAALFEEQRRLQAVFNLGAGVDALLALPTLPPQAQIFRLEDAGMARTLTEYVLAAVLRVYRRFDRYALSQAAGALAARTVAGARQLHDRRARPRRDRRGDRRWPCAPRLRGARPRAHAQADRRRRLPRRRGRIRQLPGRPRRAGQRPAFHRCDPRHPRPRGAVATRAGRARHQRRPRLGAGRGRSADAARHRAARRRDARRLRHRAACRPITRSGDGARS